MHTQPPAHLTGPEAVPPRVLVADDDAETRALLTDVLTADGMIVRVADSGDESFAQLDAFHPDLILLGSRLRDIDSVAACARLRTLSHGAEFSIVMLLSSDEPVAVERAFAAGADDILIKPIHLTLLRMRLRQLLQARQRAQLQDITARDQAELALRASEARFRTLFEHSPDGIVLIDPHDPSGMWLIVDCNQSYCTMNGYTREELVGQSMDILNPGPEFFDAGTTHLDRIRAAGEVRDEDVQRRKDGTLILIEYTTTLVTLDGRELILGIDRDITARKQVEAALRLSEARYRALVDNFPNGAVFLFDHDLRAAIGGGTSLGASGLSSERVEGKIPWEILPREIVARDEPFLRAALAGEATHREVPFGALTFAVDTLPVRDEHGTITGGMVMTQDITERKRFETQLLQHAFYDRLTSLPNRALFLDRLTHALDRLRRGATGTCAVFFLDLDQFKVVNDSLGHLAGDRLLVDTAQRLSRVMRTSDTLARFGGDEFAVLIEDINEATGVVALAERIQESLAAPFILEGHQMAVSASIGMAVTTTGTEQPEDIVRNADIAMYRAKARGKGQHALFDPAMHAHALARLHLESDLRYAIEQSAFVLHYQPIMHLASGQIMGVEALVRWHHPKHGLIQPAMFIPIAEETGLIVPLGTVILRLACRQMAAWQAQGVAPAYVTVNLSAQQVHHPGLAATIHDILEETGLAAMSLAVEVTETGMMQDIALATTVLNGLQELGIKVLAIDDFGTGYASLSYLQQLPVTHIKIDRSFVYDITTNSKNATLVRAMIAMAHGLDLLTIAEGVETGEQRRLMHTYGCDGLQGYLISRPLPAADLLPMLLASVH